MWIQISDKSIKGLLKWITTEGMILFKESTTFTIEDIKIKRPVLKYHMSDHVIDNKKLRTYIVEQNPNVKFQQGPQIYIYFISPTNGKQFRFTHYVWLENKLFQLFNTTGNYL